LETRSLPSLPSWSVLYQRAFLVLEREPRPTTHPEANLRTDREIPAPIAIGVYTRSIPSIARGLQEVETVASKGDFFATARITAYSSVNAFPLWQPVYAFREFTRYCNLELISYLP